jgi:glutathione S-transferase
MPITFYYGSGSPFVWRVHLALKHKAAPYTLKNISFSAGDLKKPELTALNPRQRVPIVVDSDAPQSERQRARMLDENRAEPEPFALYESAAILEYLEERFPDAPPLFPGGLCERALIRRMVREVDSYYYEPHERAFMELFNRPAELRDAQIVERAVSECRHELAFWERTLQGEYLAGAALSAADFTLYPFLATIKRMERVQPDLGLSQAIGLKVGAWMQRIEALPYFKKTYPPHWKMGG